MLYKIWMFAQTNRLILASPQTSANLDLDDNVRFFALLESMLIHARELMLFLYANPAQNYIRAVDYLGDRSALPPKWQGYNGDMKQINHELAHLIYGDQPEEVRWTVPQDLTPSLLGFVKAVPEDLVQPNFRVIAGSALTDQSSLGRLIVAPKDRSKPGVRGHRVHELFED